MFCKHCGSEIKGFLKYCTKCGRRLLGRNGVIFIGILVLIVICAFFYFHNDSSNEQKYEDIASSVVNIYCEDSSRKEENISGGSGTIISTTGLILTNAHVISYGENGDIEGINCLVVLPNSVTGGIKEIYYAKPVILPEISEKYDLAFMRIDDVYYDEEEDKAYGEYPKEFPAYDGGLYCKSEKVKLGEPIRIYGYPAISGDGYVLTVTDGIVSGLLQNEGLIITSAKISHGNSGGLAVDKNGCMIGIPSMTSSDENESLGIIISNDLIGDFIDEAKAIIELDESKE